jgi:hypothetical protein
MKKILFVSPIAPIPGSGNTERLATLTQVLKTLGHKVSFVYTPLQGGYLDQELLGKWGNDMIVTPYHAPKPHFSFRVARKLRLRTLQHKLKDERLKNRPIDYWYDRHIDEILNDLHKRNQYDVVIAVNAFWSRCLEVFDGSVRKVIDTHDVLSDRYKVMQKAKVRPPFWPWGSISVSPADEKKGLERSDVVLTISNDDEDKFRSLTSMQIVTVGHILSTITPPVESEARNRILFVGSNWAPNVDGVTRFVNDILPSVRLRIPDVELQIAGYICEALPDDSSYTKLGIVKNLGPVYSRATLAINPVMWGTGLAVKSIESLGHSLPLVSFASGARGLHEAVGRSLVVADSNDDFASSVVDLLLNPQEIARKRNEAYGFASEWNKVQISRLSAAISG